MCYIIAKDAFKEHSLQNEAWARSCYTKKGNRGTS